MSSPEILTEIIRDNPDWISLDSLAGTKNIWIKVLKVDETRRRMIFKIKFGKDAVAPRHFHYAEAVAITISGRWYYDEGEFGPGDVAYERAGSDHTPGSKDGAELFIVFDAPEGETRLLGNHQPDGSITDLDLKFFKSLVGN
jgi:quercetin dioxygenase-like cupin family protein